MGFRRLDTRLVDHFEHPRDIAAKLLDDLHAFGPRPDFSNWTDIRPRSENVMALITAFFLLLALICCAAGIAGRRRRPSAPPPEAEGTAEDPQN